MAAWQEGRLTKEITEEQRKVEEAELIIFQVWGYCSRSLSLSISGVYIGIGKKQGLSLPHTCWYSIIHLSLYLSLTHALAYS